MLERKPPGINLIRVLKLRSEANEEDGVRDCQWRSNIRLLVKTYKADNAGFSHLQEIFAGARRAWIFCCFKKLTKMCCKVASK